MSRVPRDPFSLVESLRLPPELSLGEAAVVLGVDKKTVLRYMRDGVIEWRNIAPPSSSRPTFRIKLESALKFRTAYTSEPAEAGDRPKQIRATRQYQSRYVRIVRP
jgi:hypothetical protein